MARTPLPRRLDQDENVNPHPAPSAVPTSMVALNARLLAIARNKARPAVSSQSLLAPPVAPVELPLTPPSSRDAGARVAPQPDGKLTSPSPARPARSLVLGSGPRTSSSSMESCASGPGQQRSSSPSRTAAPGTPARSRTGTAGSSGVAVSKRPRAAASPALDRVRSSTSSGSVQASQQGDSPNPRNRKTFRAAPRTPPRGTPSRRIASGAEWTPLAAEEEGEADEDTSIDASLDASIVRERERLASPVRGAAATGKAARKSRMSPSDDGDTSFLREVREKGWDHMNLASPVRVRIVAPAKLPVRAPRASSVVPRKSAPKARVSQLRAGSAKPRARPTPPPQAVNRISERAVAPSSPSDDPLLIVGNSSRYGRRTPRAKREVGVGSDAAQEQWEAELDNEVREALHSSRSADDTFASHPRAMAQAQQANDHASLEQSYAGDAYADEDGYDGFGDDAGEAPSPLPSPSPLPEERSQSHSRSLEEEQEPSMQQHDGAADMSIDDAGWVSGPAKAMDDDDEEEEDEAATADASQSFAQESSGDMSASAQLESERSAELDAEDVSMHSPRVEYDEQDQSASAQQSASHDPEPTFDESQEQSSSNVVEQQEYDESLRAYESDSDDGGEPEIVSIVRAGEVVEQSEAELSQSASGQQSEEISASVERSYDESHASAQQPLEDDASDLASEDEGEYEEDEIALVGGSKRGATPLLPPSPHSVFESHEDAYDYSLEQEESERQESRESDERDEEQDDEMREQRQDDEQESLEFPPPIDASDDEGSESSESQEVSELPEHERSEETDSADEVEKEVSFADMSVDEPSAMDEDVFTPASPAPASANESSSFAPTARAPIALSRAVHTRLLGKDASMSVSQDLADLSASMSHSLHARAAMLSQPAPTSIVEISSLDPRAAARATAVLRIHHRYIETGRLAGEDAEMSARSRILPADVSTSYRRAAAGQTDADATLDDLLEEAEDEVMRAMHGGSKLRAPATPAPRKATFSLEAPTPRAPGAFPKTPGGRAAAAQSIADAAPCVKDRHEILMEHATKRGVITPDPEVFSQHAWRSLDDVLGRAILLDARYLAKTHGISSHVAKARAALTIAVAEIARAFLEGHGVEKQDCEGAWRLSIFGSRIDALQRRYLLSLEDRHPGVLTPMQLMALRPDEPADFSDAPDGLRDLSASTAPAGRLSAAVNASLLEFGSPFRRGAHSTPAPTSKPTSRRGTVVEDASASQSLYPSLPLSRKAQSKQAEKPVGVKARASALLGSLPSYFTSTAREETTQVASSSKVAAREQPQPPPRAPLRQREPSKSQVLPATPSKAAPRAPRAPPAPAAPPVARQPAAAATRAVGKLPSRAPVAAAPAPRSNRPSISTAELSAARSRMSAARTARLSSDSAASSSQHDTSLSLPRGRVVANPTGSSRATPYGQVSGNRAGSSTVRPTVLAGLGTPAHALAAQKARELRQSRTERNWKSPLARRRSGVNLNADAAVEAFSLGKTAEQSFDTSRQVWKRRETLAEADANTSR